MDRTTDVTSETTTPNPTGPGLLLNAVFSLGTGLLLAVLPGTVGGWLGVSIDGWLRLLGVALVAHAALLLWMNAQRNPLPLARLNLAMIAPYPLLMVGVVAFGFVERGLGRFLVLSDGVIVGAIAFVLWRGIQLGTARTPATASTVS